MEAPLDVGSNLAGDMTQKLNKIEAQLRDAVAALQISFFISNKFMMKLDMMMMVARMMMLAVSLLKLFSKHFLEI